VSESNRAIDPPFPRHDAAGLAGVGSGGTGLSRPAPRDSLVDLLDRVLDKGVVIAGDIRINLLDIELLTIKIRLLIASADKAKEMGIDWWAHDPQLSSNAQRQQQKLDGDRENRELRRRVSELESRLNDLLGASESSPSSRPRTALPAAAAAARRKNGD
jgi:hypothetical protein